MEVIKQVGEVVKPRTWVTAVSIFPQTGKVFYTTANHAYGERGGGRFELTGSIEKIALREELLAHANGRELHY